MTSGFADAMKEVFLFHPRQLIDAICGVGLGYRWLGACDNSLFIFSIGSDVPTREIHDEGTFERPSR
jgi:hypothetical protein